MEPPIYKRKFEELQRCLKRVESLYDGHVINGSGEDTFQSPKDLVLNFFRVSYELKESLKNEGDVPIVFEGKDGVVETFCSNDSNIALALDIANKTKHINLKHSRSNKRIGPINSHIYFFSPVGKDRTELTIEIDGSKKDCLQIIKSCFNSWDLFLQKYCL